MNPRLASGQLALLCTLLVSGLVVPATARADDSPTSGVRVHIVASPPVQLQRRALRSTSWVVACNSPCDMDLPVEDEYRMLDEEDRSPGAPFRLPLTPDGAVTLSARVKEKGKPSTVGSPIGGVALVGSGVGVAALAGAGIFLGIKVAGSSCTADTSRASSASQYDQAAGACDHFYGGPGTGGVIIGVSTVLLLAGGALVAAGASLLSRSTARAPRSASSAFAPLSFSF